MYLENNPYIYHSRIDPLPDVFAALHTSLCYTQPVIRFLLHSGACIAACALLVACGVVQKKNDAWNPYELRPVAQSPSGKSLPVDNDMYYSKPGSYSCETINDAPSCVGG